jgi:hypothetical protein
MKTRHTLLASLAPVLSLLAASTVVTGCDPTVSTSDGGVVGQGIQSSTLRSNAVAFADESGIEVHVTSGLLSCAEPEADFIGAIEDDHLCPDTESWAVDFTLPADAAEGDEFDLSTLPSHIADAVTQGAGECAFIEGEPAGGTVRVVAVNDVGIELALSLEVPFAGGVEDVDATALLCGPGEGPAGPSAIAMRRDQIPEASVDPGSSVAAGGGEPQAADDLVVFLGDITPACSDPFGVVNDCARSGWEVVLTLPATYQAVGSYSLSDPALQAFFAGSLAGSDGQCAGGGGSYFEGTMDVLAIDASHVEFRLTDTSGLFTGQGNADGTYSASRCE